MANKSYIFDNVEYTSSNKRAWAIFFSFSKNKYTFFPRCKENRGENFKPDFLVNNVLLSHAWDFTFPNKKEDIWFHYGDAKHIEKALKQIRNFAGQEWGEEDWSWHIEIYNPTILVNSVENFIPYIETWMEDILCTVDNSFSFWFIDGDDYPALPTITYDKQLQLSGSESRYSENVDWNLTLIAYATASLSKFRAPILTKDDIPHLALDAICHIPNNASCLVKDLFPSEHFVNYN